jgi:hypothetical protein
MTFDPTVYERKQDFQREPELSDEQWVERFVAFMIEEGNKQAADEFKAELSEYAKKIASTYLADRKDFVSPEEAAETDMSYWENEE